MTVHIEWGENTNFCICLLLHAFSSYLVFRLEHSIDGLCYGVVGVRVGELIHLSGGG